MQSRRRRRLAAHRALIAAPEHRVNMLLRVIVAGMVVALLLCGSLAVMAFAYLGSVKLPHPKLGRNFENSQIMAANHQVLYDMPDPTRGNKIIRPLELNPANHKQCPQGRYTRHLKLWYTCNGSGIPLMLRDATIATEDPTFYSNPGIDPLSIVRAAYQDATSGQIQSGASTITQQLVKQYVLHDNSPTFSRKLKEVVLAWQLARRYSKDYLLYYYLNNVYYGHLAYGVQAAAQTYFHVGVPHLALWQQAMLSGMPQAPTDYDPFNDPSPSGQWYSRMLDVLNYMHERGYITHGQEALAEVRAQNYANHHGFHQHFGQMRQPDFVTYAIDQFDQLTNPESPDFDPYLAHKLGNRGLHSGLRIITTLNPRLQALAQTTVHDQVAQLGGLNVSDGALVSIDTRPSCYGCVMAMVGTANVDLKHRFVNMAVAPRQPGSSFKVFNYVSAFEKGLSPASTVLDEPVNIPDSSQPTGYYSPTNYDLRWHGLVTLRTALANSYNVPAVKVELWNGVHAVAHTAHRFGISDLWRDNPGCCGYALTLGGLLHGVKLVQETDAYGAFSTGGIKVPPISFTKIVDRTNGKTLWTAGSDPVLLRRRVRVAPAAATYLVTSILSDNNARAPEFGLYSPLLLDRPAAAKTGTTNAYTDNWTVGYTPQLVTGVWVGNANNQAMAPGTNGITGAAPIWHDFMEGAFGILHLPVENFTQPAQVGTTSQCRVPNTPYVSYGSFSYDIYFTKVIPFCAVPTVPADQGSSNYSYVTPQTQQVQPAPQPQTQPTQPPAQLLPNNNTSPGNGQSRNGQSGNGQSGNGPPPLLP